MGVLNREILVIKKPIKVGDDTGVPDYGPNSIKRTPTRRNSFKDSADREAHNLLRTHAVDRALHFSYGINDIAAIPVHFPYAEHFQDKHFDEDHWKKFGNLEAERTRLEFMLGNYGANRAFPIEFSPVIDTIVSSEQPLQAWQIASPTINATARTIYTAIKAEMLQHKVVDPEGQKEGYTDAYQSPPILYKTSPELVTKETQLLERALTQITAEMQRGNYRHVEAFLDLYAHIKDPITPVTSVLGKQRQIFIDLFKQTGSHLKKNGVSDITDERGKTMITQLALESSFLALPAAENVFYVRGDIWYHELPHIYVGLKELPRGEFTEARYVFPQMRNMLDDASKTGKAMITPIAVSYFQTPGESQPRMFIIDGNNRSTALVTFDYLQSVHTSYQDRLDPKKIKSFMRKHKLHPGWERELVLTLKALPEELYTDIMSDQKRLRKLVKAQVPALLVQEQNFHTIDVERSEKYKPEIYLLQPMHQAIYNHDEYAMAIPPKKQTHGRAVEGNVLIEGLPKPGPLGIRRRHRIQARQEPEAVAA